MKGQSNRPESRSIIDRWKHNDGFEATLSRKSLRPVGLSPPVLSFPARESLHLGATVIPLTRRQTVRGIVLMHSCEYVTLSSKASNGSPWPMERKRLHPPCILQPQWYESQHRLARKSNTFEFQSARLLAAPPGRCLTMSKFPQFSVLRSLHSQQQPALIHVSNYVFFRLCVFIIIFDMSVVFSDCMSVS